MKTEAGGSDALYLPDFCTSRATLAIVLIVELTALVLTLARQSATIDFWTDLGRTSLFLLWIGLAGSALLCAVRARLAHMTVAAGSAAVLALISAVIAAVSICAYLFGRTALVVDSGGKQALRCAISTWRTSGAGVSSCARRRGCMRCRRGSGRISCSTA